MTGQIKWKVDAQFKKIVEKAAQHDLTPRLTMNPTGIFIALNPPKGKTGAPIKAYAEEFEAVEHTPRRGKKDPNVAMLERLHAICGDDEFAEDMPMDFLSQVIDTECVEFIATFTATKVKYTASGERKPAKGGKSWLEKFHDYLDKQTLPTIKLFVKCADEWNNETDPPKGWMEATTEAKRKKMVAWLKEEFNETELCRELNSDYEEKRVALEKLNRMRKARGMKQVEVF
jgi:hypothetical protein